MFLVLTARLWTPSSNVRALERSPCCTINGITPLRPSRRGIKKEGKTTHTVLRPGTVPTKCADVDSRRVLLLSPQPMRIGAAKDLSAFFAVVFEISSKLSWLANNDSFIVHSSNAAVGLWRSIIRPSCCRPLGTCWYLAEGS